jgi:hypothetical protein
MNEQYDVIIVAAGPARIYLGWEITKNESSVIMEPLEKMEFTLRS